MKKVVIIGGGFAGALAARKLEKRFQVTLIDKKDYFEFTPSILRTLVEPGHINIIQSPHKEYLQKATIIKGKATDISDHAVEVDGKKHPFDYLVIATGSSYHSKIKQDNLVIASRSEELQRYAQRLAKAKNILIIGGGIVGVELAAEIIEKYPGKDITIVHAAAELIDRSPKAARQYALNLLQKKGVKIVFGERIRKHQGEFVSDKGKKYSCGLVFLCTGIVPNYQHLGICLAHLNEKNSLCVNAFLQVQGRTNIFAAGDITNVKEEKTAQASEKQAALVVKNIMALEEEKDLQEYSSKPKPMVISLGKRDGILIYKKIVLTGIIPAFLKWFVEWKTMKRYR